MSALVIQFCRVILFGATALLLQWMIGSDRSTFGQESKAPLGDRPAEKTGLIPGLVFDGAPKTAWRFTTSTLLGGRGPGLCDPATSGGMLFFGDDNGVVRALTARQGVPIWTHEHGERVYFAPTCDGQRLLFTTRKGITALESSSGIHLWHRSVTHSAGRCVAWADTDSVFFSDSDGWLYALNCVTGHEKWKGSFMDDAPEDPPGFDGERARFEGTAARPTGIATDGVAVYQSVFDQCRVVSFDCQTGERRAVFPTQGWVFADPAVDDKRLYVGSQDQHLYCFDKRTGGVIWKQKTNSRIESCPGVTDSCVVVGSCDGRVYCWAKQTGMPLWVTLTDNPGAIYSAPIVTRDAVYLAAGEGTVYALALETGEVRWKHRPSATSHLYSCLATDGTRLFVKCRPKDGKTGENAIFAISPEGP